MSKLRSRVRRLAGMFRAALALGPAALPRLLVLGSGCSIEIVGPSIVDLGNRVAFGKDCGIAVISLPGCSAAELKIGERTSFQARLKLNCYARVQIGSNCVVSWDVQILDNDFHQIIHVGGFEPPTASPVQIGDKVWIGARVTILKGVTIGAGSVVAAGSVVTKSFPERSLIGGNPARLIKPIAGWRP